MTILSTEKFYALKTRPGMENWLVPGVKVRCVNITRLEKSFTLAALAYGRSWPSIDLTAVHTVATVRPDSRVETWLRFTVVGYPALAFAPETHDGTVVWEPSE